MKSRWSLKEENKGASLIAVLTALIFVGVIAVIITGATIANIEMKEVERGGKKNFYQAESVLSELAAGLNTAASAAMEEAYADYLEHYTSYAAAGKDSQQEFTRKYMDCLKSKLADGSAGKRISYESVGSTVPVYEISRYRVDVLKDCIATAELRNCLVTDPADAEYTMDYPEGIFTLRNVKVTYQDAQEYETTITTDLVFHTPSIDFNSGQAVKGFMKYSLIADRQLQVNAPNIGIDGNVYAGADGILGLFGGSATMTGDRIVTRGDIAAESGSALQIGSGASKIWAENINTRGKGSPSTLLLDGNCYIADDLTLNGKGSHVELSGNYYGYNYQENYGSVSDTGNSSFSSAIMVNARDCKLNMSNLNYLMLSGRTYISRGSAGNTQNSDIMLGESLSVRTNQLAYFVPEDYLEDTDGDGVREKFTADGLAAYQSSILVNDVASYLDVNQPVTPYHYIDNVMHMPIVCYYLNFASSQKANEYFKAYFDSNHGKLEGYAQNYIDQDAIILDDSRLYTFRGDIMYRGASGEQLQEKVAIEGGEDWTEGGVFWDYAGRLAVTYKSLQLELEEQLGEVSVSDVRITNEAGEIDKTADPLFERLIHKQKLQDALPAAAGSMNVKEVVKEEAAGITNHYCVAVLVNNPDTVYSIPAGYEEGVIIATGDVMVPGTFSGMILSGGTISFAANASVKADERNVSKLFLEDLEKENPEFAAYFKCYDASGSREIGGIRIADYLTYENWQKN